ncbi:MAG: glycosyltransferase family 4 protein, partial [Anaerolineae bacterium]|nr:glycosyltransferase family 4 protein [Anaerolineae bacterium]
MIQVHQFHPRPAFGDAASNHVLSLQALLRAQGYRSDIYCEEQPLHFEGQTRPIAAYSSVSAPENVLLLHYTMIYSQDVLAWLRGLPDRKVLVYHNITPHTYFARINQSYYETARQGREQLRQIREMFDAGWGVSTYNCDDLAQMGWTRLDVLPIVVEPRRYAIRPARGVMRQWAGKANVLFVGRVSPNKCFEDLIVTFAHLKRHVRPDANLLLVGSTAKMGPYLDYLRALIGQLGLADVAFTGHVSSA